VRKLLERSLGERHRERLDEALVRFKNSTPHTCSIGRPCTPRAGRTPALRRQAEGPHHQQEHGVHACPVPGLGIDASFREIIGGDLEGVHEARPPAFCCPCSIGTGRIPQRPSSSVTA
jgi:hypothetical protein